MKKSLQNLSIRTQLLILILPVVVLAIGIYSYLEYVHSSQKLYEREKQKKENIKSGVKQFIDNYDLSLKLIETRVEKRIKNIYHSLLPLNVDFKTVNLDSLRKVYHLNTKYEDLYVIDKSGEIINTTLASDLGINFYDFGSTYKKFLNDVWLKDTLVIERVANESATNTPRKYAYQPVNKELILEVGIKSPILDSLIEDFDKKLDELAGRYSNIKSIDLFGGTEVLIPKNKNAQIADSLKPVAIHCLLNKKDTTIVSQTDPKIFSDFVYVEMREAEYYKGYILYIVSDDSLEKQLLKEETKDFLISLAISLLIAIILITIITGVITKPIEVLTDKLAKMNKQSELKEIHIIGNKEVKVLSEKFNSLILKNKDLQSGLEHKIKERTQELNDKNQKLEKLLKERNTLIKEIHHRVKNNLQIISSLLHLQARTVTSDEAKNAFEQSVNRVQAMGLLHEKLYQNSNFISVDAKKYLGELIALFKKTVRNNIKINLKTQNVTLTSSQAISIGLMLNEFISNSLKHAFDKNQEGEINIELYKKGNNLVFVATNNGKPLPKKFTESNNESLGMTIIEAFTEKLDGEFSLYNINNGVELKVIFPIKNQYEEE